MLADVSDTRIKVIENGIITTEHYIGNKMTNEALTIQERLKTWNIAGVSIAVIKDFAIEWADGYGYARPDLSIFLPLANEVCKVMFSQVFVCPQGGLCPGASLSRRVSVQ